YYNDDIMDKWIDMSGLTKRQRHLSVLWRSLSLKEEELMRVKRLKEKYQFASDIAACSDFGWDDVKQCVVMDNKEILAAYLK
ncbi:hypothetical protein S83_015602, partial [Arachis hypogaea]